MSAFIVSRHHIQQLVEALQVYVARQEEPSVTGQILWQENIDSVQCRYPNDQLEDLPTNSVEDIPYEYWHRVPEVLLSPLTLYKLSACYHYQSCEHSDYEQSEAARLIVALQAVLEKKIECELGIRPNDLRENPLWQAAPWDI